MALTMLTSERDELVKRSVSSLFTFSTLVSLSAEITSASTFLPVVSPLSDGCSGSLGCYGSLGVSLGVLGVSPGVE